MVQTGVQPELLLGSTGTACTSGICGSGAVQTLDLGQEHQIVLELRPAHDPTKAYGFVNTVVSLNDLSRRSGSGTERTAHGVGRDEGHQHSRRTGGRRTSSRRRSSPSRPCPPLVTDIELSVDDQFLYVSCWGTGELKQFDVSDPFNPKRTGSVRIGGIVAPRATSRRQRGAQRRAADGRGQP